jgi:hypothetical protein
VHGDRHDARLPRPLGVEAVELVLGSPVELGRRVVLDQHHREVVDLHRVRNGDERAARRADERGLVVVDPVADVLDALRLAEYSKRSRGSRLRASSESGVIGPPPSHGRDVVQGGT